MLIDGAEYAALPAAARSALGVERRRFKSVYGSAPSRRVLLIGGAGYIGGAVTAYLLSRGAAVRNLDCLIYRHGAAMLGFVQQSRYEFQFGDMADPGALERALAGITDVVLLAGLVGDPITKAYPNAAGEINDRRLRACIDALNGHKLNKVVFISTCSNYGAMEEGVIANEESMLNPLSLYARSKVAAEQHILSLAGKVDYAPVILRFATAFGLAPRMRFDLTVNEFTRAAFLGDVLQVYDAQTWRPYCHVRDFARLIGRVLEFPIEDVSFEVFNAGGDENNATKEGLVGLLLERLPGRTVTYGSGSGDPRNYRVSFGKVKRRLHFVPRYTIRDGMEEIMRALSMHVFDDVDQRRSFFGNYVLRGFTHDDAPALDVDPECRPSLNGSSGIVRHA